jgi:hypothetical protein
MKNKRIKRILKSAFAVRNVGKCSRYGRPAKGKKLCQQAKLLRLFSVIYYYVV